MERSTLTHIYSLDWGEGGGNDGEPRSRDPLGNCRMNQMRKYGSLHQGVKMERREWMEKIRDSIGWAW